MLVTHSNQAGQWLSEHLAASGARINLTANASEARRILLNSTHAVAIIDAPLPDEFGHALAAECTEAGMDAILLVKAELSSEVADQASHHHIIVLPKPLTPDAFHQTIYILSIARQRLALLQEENQRLHQRIEEMRWVERAKLLLMEKKHMSEAQAHRTIEKQAMDLRRPKVWVAQRIIQLFKE